MDSESSTQTLGKRRKRGESKNKEMQGTERGRTVAAKSIKI